MKYKILSSFKYQYRPGRYLVWYSHAGLFTADEEKALVIENANEAEYLCAQLNRTHATCYVVKSTDSHEVN